MKQKKIQNTSRECVKEKNKNKNKQQQGRTVQNLGLGAEAGHWAAHLAGAVAGLALQDWHLHVVNQTGLRRGYGS